MRTAFAGVLLLMFAPLLISCSIKPSEEELRAMIIEAEQYPRQRDISLDIANVYHAAHLTREKLPEKGYVKVNTKVSASDAENMQRIEFNPKAKPFLIGTVQQRKVKSASMMGGTYLAFDQKIATYKVDFKGITAVRFNKDENKAIVKYEAVYKDLTPFANLVTEAKEKVEEGQTFGKEAYLVKYEQGWKIEKRPTMDFMNF